MTGDDFNFSEFSTNHFRKNKTPLQLQFLGHVLRKGELEEMAITGKIEGKRAIGRQKLTFISSLSHWMKIGEKEIIRTAKDRELWRTMAANVLEEKGTKRDREKNRRH